MMLQIYIDGEELEIPRQDIAVETTNFRFSSPIADAWTNDFEIPLTERNRRLLKIYGVLDRAGALSKQTRCTAIVGGAMFDGYMQVTSVREHTADVTAYMGDFPFEILDKRLTDLLKDDERTILQHGTYAEDTALAAFDAHYWRFDAGNYDSTQGFHHPSVSVNHLLSRINAAAGTNIAAVGNESLHIVSTRRMLCPENPRQVLYWRTDGVAQGGKAPVVQGGQHIVDDYKDARGESSVTEVAINRKCSAKVTFKARTRQAQNVTVSVMTSRGIISLLNIAGGGTVQETVIDSFSFEDGDVVRAQIAGFSGSADIIALFEFSDYAITSDDYGIDMDYVSQSYTSGGVEYGERHPVFPEWTHGGSTLNPMVVTGWAYMYFGAVSNLPDISVRDLLSGLVWVAGKKIARSGNSVEWMDASDSAVIDAEITEIRPSSEKLGKVSTIGYNGEISPFAVRISNDFIEAEKILHESPFVAIYTDKWSWATIPLYSTEAERSDSGAAEYTSRFDGIDGAVIAALADFPLISKKGLVPPPRLATMGFSEITGAIEVEGRTFAGLAGLDYIFVDGRKYMLVSSTADCVTGVTDFVAIEARKIVDFSKLHFSAEFRYAWPGSQYVVAKVTMSSQFIDEYISAHGGVNFILLNSTHRMGEIQERTVITLNGAGTFEYGVYSYEYDYVYLCEPYGDGTPISDIFEHSGRVTEDPYFEMRFDYEQSGALTVKKYEFIVGAHRRIDSENLKWWVSSYESMMPKSQFTIRNYEHGEEYWQLQRGYGQMYADPGKFNQLEYIDEFGISHFSDVVKD